MGSVWQWPPAPNFDDKRLLDLPLGVSGAPIRLKMSQQKCMFAQPEITGKGHLTAAARWEEVGVYDYTDSNWILAA